MPAITQQKEASTKYAEKNARKVLFLRLYEIFFFLIFIHIKRHKLEKYEKWKRSKKNLKFTNKKKWDSLGLTIVS